MRLLALIHATRAGRYRLSHIFSRDKRITGSQSQTCLIDLISPTTASQRLNISSTTLEYLADACMITHYEIDGEIRFDPRDLNAWVHRHKIDEIGKTILDGLNEGTDLEQQS